MFRARLGFSPWDLFQTFCTRCFQRNWFFLSWLQYCQKIKLLIIIFMQWMKKVHHLSLFTHLCGDNCQVICLCRHCFFRLANVPFSIIATTANLIDGCSNDNHAFMIGLRFDKWSLEWEPNAREMKHHYSYIWHTDDSKTKQTQFTYWASLVWSSSNYNTIHTNCTFNV